VTKGAINGMSEDRERLAKVRAKLAALFTEDDLADCRTILLEVARDQTSRQRVNAVALIFQVVQEADVEAKQGKNDVRVVVLQASDVQRLGEMQRANVVPMKAGAK
jgi:hypothetical protein